MGKKLLLIFISILLIGGICFSDTRSVGDNYQLQYTITDIQGIPVSGQLPSVKIRKLSNGDWYDFSDNTFKTSGVVVSSTTLTEDTVGNYYYYTYVPPASETFADQYSFILDNLDVTYRDHQTINVDYLNLNIGTGTIVTSVWNTPVVAGSTTTPYNILTNIDKDTNGVKDGGVWNGVEKLIKQVN